MIALDISSEDLINLIEDRISIEADRERFSGTAGGREYFKDAFSGAEKRLTEEEEDLKIRYDRMYTHERWTDGWQEIASAMAVAVYKATREGATPFACKEGCLRMEELLQEIWRIGSLE